MKDFVLTLTADNGKEFANHETIASEQLFILLVPTIPGNEG